jgi:hypothetical protein
MSDIRRARTALVRRILEGAGKASPSERRAAFNNSGLAEPIDKLLALHFPEIDCSAGETLRVICTGESMEIVRRNQNSRPDTSCHQNLGCNQIIERPLPDRK